VVRQLLKAWGIALVFFVAVLSLGVLCGGEELRDRLRANMLFLVLAILLNPLVVAVTVVVVDRHKRQLQARHR
jgi:hypothetical protein